MGKPYSMDLRERILAYVVAGQSCRAAARVFGVSASTAVRLAGQQRLRGHVAPKRQGRAPGTAGKLGLRIRRSCWRSSGPSLTSRSRNWLERCLRRTG